MRNKLPILLALILMAAAATPWLRSLESQRWGSPPGMTTVPPPDHPAVEAISTRSKQTVDGPKATSSQITDTSQTTLPKPQALLDSAVHAVESRRYISARIKQQGELFGRQFTGEGRYYELRQGPIPRIHFELTMEVGAVSTSLVEVCNGTTYWTYRKLPDRDRPEEIKELLSKLDAVRATAALEKHAGALPRDSVACARGWEVWDA